MNNSQIFSAAHKSAKQGASWMSYAKRFKAALKSEYAKEKASKIFLSPEQICERIRAIDRAFNPNIEGGYIVGYYRGKSSEFYKFDIANRFCTIDRAGFSRIINQIYSAK
jgi:hypothetical protein